VIHLYPFNQEHIISSAIYYIFLKVIIHNQLKSFIHNTTVTIREKATSCNNILSKRLLYAIHIHIFCLDKAVLNMLRINKTTRN